MSKSPDAFRTISEVAEWLGIQAHVLRFWESKFTQIKPVKRAGGRRYYRPADVDLLGSIKVLLHDQGMAIKDVQALLREHGAAHVASLADPDAPSAAQGDAAASDVEPIENASADPVQGDVIEATVEATFEPVEPPAAPAPTPPAPAAAPGAWAEPASPAPATAAPTPATAPAPQAVPPAAEAPQSAPTPVQADPAQPVQTQPVQTQPVQPQPVQTQPQMQAQPQVQPTVQPPAAPPAAASDAAEQAQPTATPTPTPAAPTYAAPVQDGVTQAAAPTQAPADPAPTYQPQAPSALAHGATAPTASGIGDDAPAPQEPAAAVSTPVAAGPAPIVPTASPSVSVDPVQAAVSEAGDIHPPEPQSETALPQTSFGAAAGSADAVPAYDGAPTAPQPAQSTLFGESTEAPAPSPAAPVSAAPSPAVPASAAPAPAAPSSAEPVATPPAQPATSDGAGEHLQPDLLGDLPQIEEPADLIEAADSLPSDLPPVAEVDRLAPAPEDVEAAAVEAPSAPQSPLPQDTAPATPFADAADETPATNVTDAPAFAAGMPAQTAPQEAPATDIFAAETAVDAPADLAEPAQPVDEVSDFTQAPAMDPDLGANPAEVEIDLADRTDAPVFDAEADLDDNPLAVAGALDQEPADVAPLDVAEDTAAALTDDLGGHADPLAEAEDLPDLAALDGVDVDQALHDAPYESEEPTPEDAPLDMFDAPQEPEAEFAADMEAAAEPMAAEDSALDDSAAEDLLAVDPVETAEAETFAPDDALHDAAQDLTAPMEQLAEISQPIAGAEDAGSLAEEPAQELELELGDSADVASDAVAFELDLTEADAEQQDAEAEIQAPVVTPASEDVAEGEVEALAEEIPAEDMSVDMATEPAGASDDAPLSDEVSIDLTDDLQGDLQDDLKGDLQDDMSAPLTDEGAAAEAETGEVAEDAAETDAGDPLADGLGAELVAEPAPQEQTLDAAVADDAAEESTDSQGDQSQADPLRARVVIVPDLRDGVPEPRAAVLSHLAGLERVPAHLQEEIADCLRALRG